MFFLQISHVMSWYIISINKVLTQSLILFCLCFKNWKCQILITFNPLYTVSCWTILKTTIYSIKKLLYIQFKFIICWLNNLYDKKSSRYKSYKIITITIFFTLFLRHNKSRKPQSILNRVATLVWQQASQGLDD